MIALSALTVTLARADEPPPFVDAQALSPAHGEPEPARPMPRDLFMYTYPPRHDTHYIRAALEVVSILVLGNIDYLQNTRARGGTVRDDDEIWDLRYDWPQFRRKLTGDAFRLDHNHFNTNYIAHPFAGTAYYTAARSNHLSVLESFGYAFTGSLLWEYFGELREDVSVNDMLVTPFSGFAIGEPLMQLSGFFSRGRDNVSNGVAAALLAPLRVLNDWADGASPVRSANLDAGGLPRDVWHRFGAFVGVGVTAQGHVVSGAPATVYYLDTRAGFDLRLANLPGYDGAIRRETAFADANVSGLHFEVTLSDGRLADALFATRLVPFGYYSRDASVDAHGVLRGSGTVLGWLAAFEYGVHDFDRDRARPLDVMAIASPLGATFEHSYQAGETRVRTAIDVTGEIAGVTAYALSAYRAERQNANLQTSVSEHGYYHALGVSAAPSLELSHGALEVGGRFRLDAFRGIEGLDANQADITREIPLADRRMSLRLWSALAVGPIRFEIAGKRLSRTGGVGEARASQTELGLMGSAGLVF